MSAATNSVRDAADVRLAQGVEIVLVAGLLLHEPFGQGEFPLEPLEDAGAADQGKLPADVRRDQFREAAQLRQRLLHLLEPAPPAQPARLAEKTPGKPRACPPGPEAALAGEFQQALAGLVANSPSSGKAMSLCITVVSMIKFPKLLLLTGRPALQP